ncbi:MAG: hypothetical protein HONDAALG_03947 [Gammaproteobacteria bacterium]|nr:hypothetical protein [Gammaproteobacteria bacterium]
MTILNKPFHATRAHSRGVNTVQAIILHEINESAGQVDGRMQTALTHVGLAHQSYHYAVDASAIRAYVPITDAVYAIADTDTMSPWTIAAANPGIEPDLYTVNIAVLIGAAPMSNPCVPGCERTYPAQLLQNLQRLLSMIGIAASIDITDTEVVWRHGTELCDLDVEPLLEPIDPFDPGQEDWLCDRLAALPLGESETPMLVGSDCALYPYPTEHPWQINANGTGRQTQYGIASGLNSLASGGAIGGGGNEASGNYSATIGGYSNTASGHLSAAIGGDSNTASGNLSAAIGGSSNVASSNMSAAIGGGGNEASGNMSAAIGGSSNVAIHLRAVIAGGQNMASVADDTLHCAKLAILSIPTSAVGLASGMIWSDSGTLKIVP